MLSVGSRAGCLARSFCYCTTSFHVNDRRHKNRQSSWFELDFDMDIGTYSVCKHAYMCVCVKVHIPNMDMHVQGFVCTGLFSCVYTQRLRMDRFQV